MAVDTSGLRRKIREVVETKMRAAMDAVNEYEWLVFKTEGEQAGSRWKSISDTTRRIRQQFGVSPDNPILHARGVLSRAWEVRGDLDLQRANITLQFNDVYNVWDQTRGFPALELASAHHHGYGRRYPRRPLFSPDTLRAHVLGVLK